MCFTFQYMKCTTFKIYTLLNMRNRVQIATGFCQSYRNLRDGKRFFYNMQDAIQHVRSSELRAYNVMLKLKHEGGGVSEWDNF